MEFCYARVGRGVPQSSTDAEGIDVRWERNRDAASAAGLRVGGYWRFFPGVDLGDQVVRLCDRLEGTTLPPMVDIEDQMPGWDAARLTDWAIEALERVQEDAAQWRPLRALPPLLYTYRWFLANAVEGDRLLPRWPLALAAVTDTWPDDRAVMWQHALDVKVPWAVGNVDLDRWRGPLPG